MIKTQQLTPEVYYRQSRDFQLLGRVVDFVMNYLRATSSTISNIPLSENFDTRLIDLVATTLGFKKVHEYNVNELLAFCQTFSHLLRNKGNMRSIKDTITLIANTQGIKEDILLTQKDSVLGVYIPSTMKDYSLLSDVLDYILPAGMSCEIRTTPFLSAGLTDYYSVLDAQSNETHRSIEFSQVLRLQAAEESGDDPYKLPKLSDIAASRIDDSVITPALEPGEDISDYIKN